MLVEDFGFSIELRRGNKCVARGTLPSGDTITWVTSNTPSDSRRAHRAALRDLKRQLDACGIAFDTHSAPRLGKTPPDLRSNFAELLGCLRDADADMAAGEAQSAGALPEEDSDEEILAQIDHEHDDNFVTSYFYGKDAVVGIERVSRRLHFAIEAHKSWGLLAREMDPSLSNVFDFFNGIGDSSGIARLVAPLRWRGGWVPPAVRLLSEGTLQLLRRNILSDLLAGWRFRSDYLAIADVLGRFEIVLFYEGRITEETPGLLRKTLGGGYRWEDRKMNLLVLRTCGGSPEGAFRASRWLSKETPGYECVVLDSAYSAGTLIAMGAARLHMDSLACLGPLDMQAIHPLGIEAAWSHDGYVGVEDALEAIKYLTGSGAVAASSPTFVAEYLCSSGLNAVSMGQALRMRRWSRQMCQQVIEDSGTVPDVAGRLAEVLAEGFSGHGHPIDGRYLQGVLGKERVLVADEVCHLVEWMRGLLDSAWLAGKGDSPDIVALGAPTLQGLLALHNGSSPNRMELFSMLNGIGICRAGLTLGVGKTTSVRVDSESESSSSDPAFPDGLWDEHEQWNLNGEE